MQFMIYVRILFHDINIKGSKNYKKIIIDTFFFGTHGTT